MKPTLIINHKWWLASLLIAITLFFWFSPATRLLAQPAQQTGDVPASCQITEITFNRDHYQLNEQMKIVVRVADQAGAPLSGVHVTASVEKDVASSEATDGFGLNDQTGTYHGVYNQTDVAGLYQFLITASDPTGSRFSPCSEQATVAVGDVEPADLPDLIVSSMAVEFKEPASCQDPANPLGLRVKVTNIGQVEAGSFVLEVNDLQQTVTTPLAPNESLHVFFAGHVPSGQETTAFVDATAQVDESNEDNNVLSQFLPIPTPLPPCSGTDTPTPTPTLTQTPDTPTPTPTNTPTPTPTVPAGETTVKPSPQNLPLCNAPQQMAIAVENVTNLVGFELVVRYNPQIVRVVDANSNQTGVQVNAGSAFADGFVGQHQVDPDNGRIAFATILLGGENIDGNTDLILIDWQPQQAGTSQVTLEDVRLVNLEAREISHTTAAGTIQVSTTCNNTISGVVSLQGRQDHSQVVITNAAGQQTETDAQGNFTITGAEPLTLHYPGYLSAQASPGSAGHQASAGSDTEDVQPLNLGRIELLAGDINADNLINILDLTYIALHIYTTDSLADLNADGQVNILDLAITANNYQKQGPLTGWQ